MSDFEAFEHGVGGYLHVSECWKIPFVLRCMFTLFAILSVRA